jgi:taurine dioxygenase
VPRLGQSGSKKGDARQSQGRLENWHSDLSYKAEPSMGALLYALEVPPEEGDTFFASMHAAYDALDEATKTRIRHLSATHSYANYHGKAFADRNPLTPERFAATPDAVHPLVRTHPETGRLSLYVGQDVLKKINGLPADESEAWWRVRDPRALPSQIMKTD